MERIEAVLMDALLDTFIEKVRKRVSNIYLVGGAIRDAFYGKELKDFDFVLPKADFETTLEFLKKNSIKYFSLDKDNRLFVRAMQNDSTFDFMKIADNINKDLVLRDYTINAIYYSLCNERFLYEEISRKDLMGRVLRVVSPVSIQQDPVRVLRGVRLAAEFNLSIEGNTERNIKEGFSLLKKVKSERRREEAKKILDLDIRSVLNVLGVLFPEKDFSLVREKVKLSEQFKELDEKINKDFTYRDTFVVALFSYVFSDYPIPDILGLTQKEKKTVRHILEEKTEDNFQSIFSLFMHFRNVFIPVASVLFWVEESRALEVGKLLAKWSKIKIDGNRLKEKFNVKGEELGKLKQQLLEKKCRKIYDKI